MLGASLHVLLASRRDGDRDQFLLTDVARIALAALELQYDVHSCQDC